MTATRAEEVLRTVTAIVSSRERKVEFRLDGSRIVGEPLGLNCVLQTNAPASGNKSIIPALLEEDFDDPGLLEECRARGVTCH